jgi:hypothetical protein
MPRSRKYGSVHPLPIRLHGVERNCLSKETILCLRSPSAHLLCFYTLTMFLFDKYPNLLYTTLISCVAPSLIYITKYNKALTLRCKSLIFLSVLCDSWLLILPVARGYEGLDFSFRLWPYAVPFAFPVVCFSVTCAYVTFLSPVFCCVAILYFSPVYF